jgi:hypothetical protein
VVVEGRLEAGSAAKAGQERTKVGTKKAATALSEPLAGVSDEELVAELILRLEARAVELTEPRLQWLKPCLAE